MYTTLQSYLLGGVFLFAGSLKLLNISNFARLVSQIKTLSLLDHDLVLFLSLILCVFELLIGSMFVSKRFRFIAAWLCAALSSFFITLNVLLIFSSSTKLSCGCFGQWSFDFGPKLLIFDSVILFSSLTIFYSYKENSLNE